ncbi:hypothetical protein C5Y96_01350 [Blastopirellula marina]|uniref:Uncharacterized protein n=1 Tax=Blastopirellula marina TaxID=124 RepID=A0A2S8G8J2_9BACT|nr:MULTISPECIES: hypothetical protein [Pirellulaceae]PQO40747.1 hypothetical protein C5Y96_01350 [Blastopirellula marina]RCS56057.1 hypothetical protein DTL36_01350 [Bremerella cremea]
MDQFLGSMPHESERDISQFAAERDQAIQEAISQYNLHAGGGEQFDVGSGEETVTYSTSSGGYIANAKEYEVLAAEWAEYYRISNPYHQYTPPSTTLQEAADSKKAKDLDAQVAYSKATAASNLAHVTAIENSKKTFAAEYVTEANQFADKIQQVNDQLSDKDKQTLDDFNAKLAKIKTDGVKANSAASQDYENALANEQVSLEALTAPSENTHRENTISNTGQLKSNIATNHHDALVAADFGGMLSNFLISQASGDKDYATASATEQNTFAQSFSTALTGFASSVAPVATAFASAAASAVKSAIDGYAKNSEAYAISAVQAATSTSVDQIKAENAYQAASLKAGVLHYNKQIDAEAAANIAFAQANVDWVDTVAQAKKQLALDDDQAAYDAIVATADADRDADNDTAKATQIQAVGDAIKAHASTLGDAAKAHSSSVGASFTQFVSALTSAKSQWVARDNSVKSSSLNQLRASENSQTGDMQAATSSLKAAFSTYDDNRANALAPLEADALTDSSQHSLSYQQSLAASKKAAWQALVNSQPGSRANVGLAKAMGQEAYLASMDIENSRYASSVASALEVYNNSLRTIGKTSVDSFESDLAAYASAIRDAGGNLENQAFASLQKLSSQLSDAEKALDQAIAQEEATKNNTLVDDYVSYFKDVIAAEVLYKTELLDDELAAGAELACSPKTGPCVMRV